MQVLYLADVSHQTKAKNGLQRDIQSTVLSLHRRTFFANEISTLFRRTESNVNELNKQHFRCAAESVHTYTNSNGDVHFYFGNGDNTFCMLHFLKFINQD